MNYIKFSPILFLLSLCLLLVGLLSEEIRYGYIVSGLIINYMGVAMLIIGVTKRSENNS